VGQPYATALIDTYNHERFIAEAIESVLAQDFPSSEMEILVVDDGSTDRTPEIIRSYGDRVRHIRKENGGQASALNLGFAEARGEIVAMLDGDDVWLPHKIRRVTTEFERSPDIAVVYHPHDVWVHGSNLLEKDRSFYPVYGRMPLEGMALLRYGDYGTSEISLRRTLAAAMFPIPEGLWIYADSFLVFLAVFAGDVAGVPEALTRYRCHDANLASFTGRDERKLKRRWECFAAAVAAAKQWLVRHGQDLTRPDVAAFVRRHELVGRMLRFYWDPPGRSEYFRYLRGLHELYRPLWTWRYRTFHNLLAVAGFALGYETSMALRDRYRRSRLSVRTREGLFPVHAQRAVLS